MPWQAYSDGNNRTIDLAFAAVENNTDASEMTSRFYVPMADKETGYFEPVTKLKDARDVTFGDESFSHFVGAARG